MSWTATEYDDIRSLAAARWPHDVVASSRATWDAWRPSLESRFTYAQVMGALTLCSEAREKFPPLAALIGAVRTLIERDEPTGPPRIAAPRATSIDQRLREFDTALNGATAGPYTVMARESLAQGHEPGRAAEALVWAFARAASTS